LEDSVRPFFQLGVHPLTLPAFNRSNILKVPPKQSGVYILYEPTGPFYVGRSGKDIQARLLAHLDVRGNRNVKIALRIKEVAQTLTFTYAILPRAAQSEMESVLIPALGVTKLANMRHEGMYEWQFDDV
jgi:hypothetical protein